MKSGTYNDFAVCRCMTYGPGVIWEIKRLTLGFGKRYLIITGCGPQTEYVKKAISQSFANPAGAFSRERYNAPYGTRPSFACTLPNLKNTVDDVEIEYQFIDVEGQQVTLENIEKLAEKIRIYQPDVLVSVGGGKTMDLVRSSTYFGDPYNRPKIVHCPTVVASNASASQLSIIYNEEGSDILGMWNLAYPEEAVILDTEIAVQAPVDTLIAAIGDQLCTIHEALHTVALQGIEDKLDPMIIAHHKIDKEILLKYGRKAVADMAKHELTPEIEWVMAACFRLTGPQRTLCPIFVGHALDEGLVSFEPVSKMLHGMVVGFDSLVECVYVNDMDTFYQLLDFYSDIGVPCNLEQMGIPNATYEELLEACKSCFNKTLAVRARVALDPEKMASAVVKENELACAYLAQKQ